MLMHKYKKKMFYISVLFLMLLHGTRGYSNIALITYLGFLCLVFYTLVSWHKLNYRIDYSVAIVPLLLILVMLYPAVIGVNQYGAKAGFTFLISNVFAFLFFYFFYRSKDGAQSIAQLFAVTGLLSGFMAVLLFINPLEFLGYQFGRENYFRLVGTFSTPNRFGESVAVATLASFYLYMSADRTKRVWIFSVFILLLFLTLASGSKGVIFGLAAGLLVFLFFTRLSTKKYFFYSMFLGVPALMVVVALFWNFIYTALKLDRILSGRMDVGSGRPEIWDKGREVFLEGNAVDLILGRGVTAFYQHIGADAHNAYWDILFNFGIFGLLLLAAISMFVFIVVLYKPSVTNVFAFSLVVYCLVRGISMPTVLNSFNFNMLAYWAGLVIILGSVRGFSYARYFGSNVCVQGSGETVGNN